MCTKNTHTCTVLWRFKKKTLAREGNGTCSQTVAPHSSASDQAKETLQSLSFSLLFFFSSSLVFSLSFFHDGAAEPFPTENYSESLSTAPSQPITPLCPHPRVPFPSSSSLAPARKESSVVALWRENGGIHPMLCR